MIINGIDFDHRLDEARRLLHIGIDWRAQMEGLGPFFEVKAREVVDPQMEAFKQEAEWINRMEDGQISGVLRRNLQLRITKYIMYSMIGISRFELKRL
jgi:hypothetical protein